MMNPLEWAARQRAKFQGRDYEADKKAYMAAKQAAEERARGQWAQQKANQEANQKYGIGKNKPKGFMASVFPKEQRPRKRSRQDRDYQPRSGGPGITSIPDIDWGLGGGGGRKNRRRGGGVDLGF